MTEQSAMQLLTTRVRALIAQRHFSEAEDEAAWALDPTYRPARINMERYGSFCGQMPRPVYDETDCAPDPAQSRPAYRIEYDKHGIGHVIREDI